MNAAIIRALRPLSDRILVERLREPELGPILTPEIAQQKSLRGVIIAVGPGKRNEDGERIPMDVCPGQIVYFGPFIDLEHDDLVVIRQADIRGIET